MNFTPGPGPAKPTVPVSYSSLSANVTNMDTPRSGRYDVVHELREATSSSTPLTEFLRDPVVLTSLIGHKKKSRRGSSSSQRDRDHDRERGSKDTRKREKDSSDTASILTLVLAEEERQAHHLKAVLRNTGERLDYEMRRADQNEIHARTAEGLAREATARVTTAEAARHQTELDAARAQEEIKRYQMLAEAAERSLRRAEGDVQRLERLRNEAEQSAADARDIARKAQQVLREHQAREAGKEEGRRFEVRRRYNDGREDGFEDGRAEGFEAGHSEGFESGRTEGYAVGRSEGHHAGRLIGFEEGRKVGWAEGLAEGIERGRKEERAHALDAFDKFMDSEISRNSAITTSDEDRTQRWVEVTSQVGEQSPVPVRPPSPQQVRDRSPVPIPVWLHRRLNNPQEQGGTTVPTDHR
ncbi:hypothetical protein AcW1_003646 [Taiwanofungus camphoratus]|nr:hypothetical protein AcW1_003646 [Antrodia cinnamomea]KAI0958372.1 hypothetical protein AcV7_004208 [Antrodia cinnamomea]